MQCLNYTGHRTVPSSPKMLPCSQVPLSTSKPYASLSNIVECGDSCVFSFWCLVSGLPQSFNSKRKCRATPRNLRINHCIAISQNCSEVLHSFLVNLCKLWHQLSNVSLLINLKMTSGLFLAFSFPTVLSCTLWLHSSAFTELGTILFQRQGSFPALSRPDVKMESYITQLGGNFVPGRGLLWDSLV